MRCGCSSICPAVRSRWRKTAHLGVPMPRNTMREERPLAQSLHDAAPEYKEGLVIKFELS